MLPTILPEFNQHARRLPAILIAATLLFITTASVIPIQPVLADGLNLNVNSSEDYHDASPGDGICVTSENGSCTLRAAIEETNAVEGYDVIIIGVETVNLTDQITITDHVRIAGPATINGSGSKRIFEINLSPPSTLPSVSLYRLILQNGHQSASSNPSDSTDVDGGAVLNHALLIVENCIFTNNSANDGYGGAITNSGWELRIYDSEFRENEAKYGGAIASNNGNYSTIERSTFVDNFCDGSDTDGDVIHDHMSTALFMVRNLTVMATNSSLTGTAFFTNRPLWGMGLNNVTLVNYARCLYADEVESAIVNSVLVGTTTPNYGLVDEDHTQYFTGLEDAGLSALADNGGALLPDGTHPRTFAVNTGSSLIDAGADASCELTDERGAKRVDIPGVGSASCDAGAYEYIPPAELIYTPDETMQVSEDGTVDSYTIHLSKKPTADVSVTASQVGNQVQVSQDGTTFQGAVTLTFTTANWDTPQTVTIQAVDDTQVEGAHSSLVTHTTSSSDPAHNAVFTSDVLVEIEDNDRVTSTNSLALDLDEAVSAQVASAGDTVKWTFVITNQVSESSLLVDLNIAIPSELTVLDVSTTQGIVTSATAPTVTVDIGSVGGNGQIVVTVTTQLNGGTVAFSAPGVMASLSRQAAGETICVTGNIPGDSATACITVLPDGLPDTGGRPIDGFPWQFFLLAGLVMFGAGVVLLRRKQPLPAE